MSERADTFLFYGESGTGKTVQIGEVAKWEFARTGGITRLISADSGWDPIEELVWKPGRKWGEVTPSGPVCIQAWNVQYLLNPFPVLIKLSEGFWPKWQDGKMLMVGPRREAGPEGRIFVQEPEDKAYCTQVACEGLSTFSNMVMRDHIRRQRPMKDVSMSPFSEKIEVEIGGKVLVQEEKFAIADRSHYMQVQDFMLLDLVPRFGTLPVSRVFWTAHEAKGTDDMGVKDSALGPATIGKATVAKTVQKFGDSFHFSAFPSKQKDGSLRLERRAYYEAAPDTDLSRLLWPAKLSFPLRKVESLRKIFPGGFIPLSTTKGMEAFLEFKYSAA